MNEVISQMLKQYGADPSTFAERTDTPGVLTGTVPGDRAAAAWMALRDAFDRTGLWPIIRGEVMPDAFGPVDAAAILRTVPDGSISQILQAELEERRETFTEQFGIAADAKADIASLGAAADAAGIFEFIGSKRSKLRPWPTTPPVRPAIPNFFATRSPSEGTRHPWVFLSLIPLQHPWNAPAHLGFGGWNACPSPEKHVAVLREWHSRYNAVPAAITHDVVECVVGRPPRDESGSMELAAEQWLYCDDIVSQGTQSVRNLAIELWQSPQWFFWWD